MSAPLLEVQDLRVQFHGEEGIVRAVDGVSFRVERGRTLAIVGESGSGKSVTQLAMMGLLPIPPARIAGGRALFHGEDLLTMAPARLRALRGDRIAMIFQDPMTSLNPFLSIERQLTEVLEIHRGSSRREARKRSIEMLERVGIPDAPRRIDQFPHEFSGGMRQRVMIAMALLCEPELLVADEPTTALDVTIQAQILALIGELRRDLGTAVILITHDLGVVASVADDVCVMYAGRIVERGAAGPLFADPRHPYTRGLLASVPRLTDVERGALTPIPGQPPDLARLGPGCAFAPRCAVAVERCAAEYPPVRAQGPDGDRDAACWLAEGHAPDGTAAPPSTATPATAPTATTGGPR